MGDTYVPRFWPPFFTLAGSSTIFLGYFFSSTNTKTIFWGIKTTNSYRIRSFRPQISFFPRSFWVQFSAASGTPPSFFGPSTPPKGPVANDLVNDALRLDNEPSALAATCLLRSVSKVQIPGGVLPMWWVIHMCRGFDPLFSLWQDRARSFGGIFLIHQQQSYLLGYKNYQFLQKSIFLAPNSIFSSIFLGPIFSGQRHTPISFQAEYPPRGSTSFCEAFFWFVLTVRIVSRSRLSTHFHQLTSHLWCLPRTLRQLQIVRPVFQFHFFLLWRLFSNRHWQSHLRLHNFAATPTNLRIYMLINISTIDKDKMTGPQRCFYIVITWLISGKRWGIGVSDVASQIETGEKEVC